MKRSEAERAAILVQAIGELDDVAEVLKGGTVASGYDFRGLNLWAGDCSRDGSVGNGHSIAVDAATGLLLIPLVRELIATELAKLGVDP